MASSTRLEATSPPIRERRFLSRTRFTRTAVKERVEDEKPAAFNHFNYPNYNSYYVSNVSQNYRFISNRNSFRPTLIDYCAHFTFHFREDFADDFEISVDHRNGDGPMLFHLRRKFESSQIRAELPNVVATSAHHRLRVAIHLIPLRVGHGTH